MNQKEILIDVVDAIQKHNESAEDILDLLITAATLTNELNSGRFKGAEYKKVLTLDRIKITVEFSKCQK